MDFCAAEDRVALAQAQLAALAAREGEVQAFTCFDAEAAREAVGRSLASGAPGPLAGALVGVKDIIETAAFPTGYGSPFPENAGPRADAWCAGEVKRLGGTVLGKTVSTEFAFSLAGPTTNPHDPARTPGGSSSGSAAAVAAGFCSFAMGTQTGGSTIRPASFCGVVGYKPSFGLLHTDGVQAISTTFDHLGLFARSARDAWLMASAMLGKPEVLGPREPGRLLHLRMPQALPLEEAMRTAMEELAAALGAETRELPFPLEDFAHLQETLCYWEAARILLTPGRVRLSDELARLLQPSLAMDLAEYAAARRRRAEYQADFAALVAGYDAVLAPAALGVAPLGLAQTGDAVMSRFWTTLHVPAVTVPLWRTQAGLPFAPQLLAALGADRHLIGIAQWLHETF